MDAERETLRRYLDELPAMKGSELAGAIQRLAISSGIKMDKSRL
jgi:hypothetical protein